MIRKCVDYRGINVSFQGKPEGVKKKKQHIQAFQLKSEREREKKKVPGMEVAVLTVSPPMAACKLAIERVELVTTDEESY